MSSKDADFSVSSLGNFVDVTTRLAEEWSTKESFTYAWFRGHADTSWRLVPSLYRLRDREEHNFLLDFVRKAPAFLDNLPDSEWDWYFLMRQHRMPTRLLDWSESAIIALYFALCGCMPKKGAAVWALDPWWLNGVSTGSEIVFNATDPEVRPYAPLIERREHGSALPKKAVAVRPPYKTERARAQKLGFTVHGANRWALDAQVHRAGGSDVRLAKILIPRENMVDMFLEIRRTAGITDSTLFPDLDGLSRDIRMYYNLSTE